MPPPPPPPESPVAELHLHHTRHELRALLSASQLRIDGSKADMSLRLVKSMSGILTPDDVATTMTSAQLRRHVPPSARKRASKSELVEAYLETRAHV